MIAHLLQPHQRLQHQAPPRHALGLLQPRFHRGHGLLVELDLLLRQAAIAGGFGFLRQVGDDRAIGLKPAQNVGVHQPAQGGELVVLSPLQLLHERLEHAFRAQQPRVEKIEQ